MKGCKYKLKRIFGWLFLVWGCFGIAGWFIYPPQTKDFSFLFWAFIGTALWFVLAYFLLRK